MTFMKQDCPRFHNPLTPCLAQGRLLALPLIKSSSAEFSVGLRLETGIEWLDFPILKKRKEILFSTNLGGKHWVRVIEDGPIRGHR